MKNYIQKVAWALVLLLAATLSLSAKDGTAVRKLFKKGVSDSISVGGSKLVVSRQMTGESVKQADFKVPASGVYVVKAISENGEHTRKISVK